MAPKKKASKKKKAKKRVTKAYTGKRGRPRLVFDLDYVRELGTLGCTEKEVASALGVSLTSIQRNKRTNVEFLEALEKGDNEFKRDLRGWQVENAKKGNATMQIWLGKQKLAQTDRVEQKHTGEQFRVVVSLDDDVKGEDNGEG